MFQLYDSSYCSTAEIKGYFWSISAKTSLTYIHIFFLVQDTRFTGNVVVFNVDVWLAKSCIPLFSQLDITRLSLIKKKKKMQQPHFVAFLKIKRKPRVS